MLKGGYTLIDDHHAKFSSNRVKKKKSMKQFHKLSRSWSPNLLANRKRFFLSAWPQLRLVSTGMDQYPIHHTIETSAPPVPPPAFHFFSFTTNTKALNKNCAHKPFHSRKKKLKKSTESTAKIYLINLQILMTTPIKKKNSALNPIL